MATPTGGGLVDLAGKEGLSINVVEEVTSTASTEAQPEDIERNTQVDAMWEKMNKGNSIKTLTSFPSKATSNVNKASQKTSHSWMGYLGMAPKKTGSIVKNGPQRQPCIPQKGTNEETMKLAAAALSKVKDSAAAGSARGKVEVTEVRDFAGEEIEVKRLVDAGSKEASEKGRGPGNATSAVDAILEQIKKKQKLSVLNKTKKDWGEYKEENKGLEEELDAYKKSSNQYLDKVSFLERTDYREFERERDVRLALQARRRPDNLQEP